MPTVTPNLGLYKPLVNNATDQDLWGGYLNDDMDIIDAYCANLAAQIAAIGSVPTGAVTDFAGTAAPAGWLLCYGQAVSRVTYSDLFAVVGTTYGVGDGVTTFNLPDKRGRASAGKDDMGGVSANRLTGLSGGVNGDVLGGTGGLETHTLTIPEIPTHDHPAEQGSFLETGFSGGAQTPGAGAGAGSHSTTGNAGGGGSHNNVQPTIIFNTIIKT